MAPAATLVTTSDLSQIPNNTGGGTNVGASTSSLIGFWGATPVVQQAAYGQITDSSGGTAAATNGIQTITGSYNSTILANAIATLAKQINTLESTLVTLGILSS